MTEDEKPLLKPLSRALQARGSLLSTEHGGLALGGDARDILKGEASVMIVVPPQRDKRRRGGRSDGGIDPVGDPLFEALRALRAELAREAGVPAYHVFSNASLREMTENRPSSRAELAGISGVGAYKLDTFGDAFLAVIREN